MVEPAWPIIHAVARRRTTFCSALTLLTAANVLHATQTFTVIIISCQTSVVQPSIFAVLFPYFLFISSTHVAHTSQPSPSPAPSPPSILSSFRHTHRPSLFPRCPPPSFCRLSLDRSFRNFADYDPASLFDILQPLPKICRALLGDFSIAKSYLFARFDIRL